MTDIDPFRASNVLTVTPSIARRGFAIGVMTLLGALLLYIALVTPSRSLLATVVLFASGVVAVFGADALRRATSVSLVFDGTALRDSNGRVLALAEDILSVERGAFAFKPSNGFLLSLRSTGQRHWSPGLWWRLGRRLGVGGVTAAGETKAMAEAIAFVIAQRTQSD